MKSGFFKVAAAVPAVKVADTVYNLESVSGLCAKMDDEGVELAVFPEMCLTGYTCADLFHNETLLDGAMSALLELKERSASWNLAFAVGLPLRVNGVLYNVAAVIRKGRIFGFVPKTYIPNYNEFYEKRWWSGADDVFAEIPLGDGTTATLSAKQLFKVNGVCFGVEICEDLWTTISPSCHQSLEGAQVILNLSASDAVIGKYTYIRSLVSAQSARCLGAYVYASAGFGESSTDLVFDGITLIAENGKLLQENSRWHNDAFFTAADIDIAALSHDRMSVSSYADCRSNNGSTGFNTVDTGNFNSDKAINRVISPTPFVPSDKNIAARCDEIVNIQTAGLAQRLKATNTKNIVVGVSGGLDSTLALLVAVKTFDRLGLDRKGIHAITMPGFGTTGRTYNNAVNLIKELGTSFREINIGPAVTQHFSDIGHSAEIKDVTYENSQARQRTLLLMDIANQVGGMVLGTGDLSELALGWATYNGDHMSMYGVNAGVPKTLVRFLVERFADGDAALINISADSKVPEILHDIAATPISPELIPADKDGNISQKTEDLVGPYELHDFFLYYMLRFGFGPKLILERARLAFEGRYSEGTILKWLRTFVRRFFAQQFKRSCLPDGPKIGSVCLSPRGDWRMPSDACARIWLDEIDD